MANEETPKKIIRKWTPEILALYLLNKDLMYAIPVIRGAEIRDRFPEICGMKGGQLSVKKIDELIASPEYEEVIKRELVEHIKDKGVLEQMFLTLLTKVWRANMEAKIPSAKPLDILGYMTKLYNPREKEQKPPGLNAAQERRLQEMKARAEKNRQEREANAGEGTDGKSL